jgi:hypothetical protein
MELGPLVTTSIDDEAIFRRPIKEGNPFYMVHRMGEEFTKIKETVKKSEIRGTNKKVLDLLKSNHSSNLKSLNKSILEILKVDEQFSNLLMDCISKMGEIDVPRSSFPHTPSSVTEIPNKKGEAK